MFEINLMTIITVANVVVAKLLQPTIKEMTILLHPYHSSMEISTPRSILSMMLSMTSNVSLAMQDVRTARTVNFKRVFQ